MSTFLELTNKLLRRLLEVQLTMSTFASAESTQATAKDCIEAAVQEIYNKEHRWPFAFKTGSVTLTAGTTEYNFPFTNPNETNAVDWESFRIQKSTTFNINTTPLRLIRRDDWLRSLRAEDEDNSTDGRGAPMYVFVTAGPTNSDFGGFGVSPNPDEEFVIDFDYYKVSPGLSAHDDETDIPSRFDYVIINFALKHFYMFKDNIEQAQLWTAEAEKALADMKYTLMPRKDSMTSTVINYGGQSGNGIRDWCRR